MRLGSYVSSQTAEPLTRISDISTVYAYFSVNEKEQLDIMMNADGKSFQDKINNMPAVNLVLSNGSLYEQKGKIETFSGQANTQTGSFNVRASFANKSKLLRSRKWNSSNSNRFTRCNYHSTECHFRNARQENRINC